MTELQLIPHEIDTDAMAATSELTYAHNMIKAPQMWAQGYKGRGVVVAVLDTGAQLDHPDLTGQVIGYLNFTDEGSAEDVTDRNGHGTHVAGTIAAKEDGQGVVGVAPEAKLLILKVLRGDGKGSALGIAEAVRYAINWRGPAGERVNVISMSLGGPVPVPELHQAIKDAVAANILVVCAAGNNGDGNHSTNEYAYPGSYDEVVQVGACDALYQVAYFSNTNDQLDLVAPGMGIKSTFPSSTWATISGTSMAAPHVAGAAALIINEWREKYGNHPLESQLYAQIIKRTVNLGADIRAQGNGLLILTGKQHIHPNTISVETALRILQTCQLNYAGGSDQIINTIEFWQNLIDKFKADPVKYEDFRYVELLIRKMAAYVA